MNPQDDSGQDVPHVALIRPTDIILGRGPACYKNPGNRVFRKLVKTNAIYYTSQVRRKEKAALVNLLISMLKTQGCRFLRQSSRGTWVEAPTAIVKKKVGHGLRDARLAADKVGGEMNVLPKNFRPAITDQKHTYQGVPFSVPTADIKHTEERDIEKSEAKDKINIDTNPQCNASTWAPQKSSMELMASSDFPRYLMQDAMMENSKMMIQEEQLGFQDVNAPTFLNELSDFPSRSCPLVGERSETQSLGSFDGEIESLELCRSCDVSYMPETYPLRPTFCWCTEGEEEGESCEGDINEHAAVQDVSPHPTPMHHTHVADVVAMALNMLGKNKEPFDCCLGDDLSQSSLCPLDHLYLCPYFDYRM